jgi:hypothetical protein
MKMVRRARFYPLCYPVDFDASPVGSPAVLTAAGESWGAEPALFPQPPLRFSIEERKGTAGDGAGPQIQDVQFRVRADGFEFRAGSCSAVFFPAERQGYMRVAPGWPKDGRSFRRSFLEPAVLAALDMVFFTPLHAACVVRNGRAALLCGDSGAGKSSLSYACVRRGWTLVADDAVHAAPDSCNTVVGTSRVIRLRESARLLFPELCSESVTTAPNGKTGLEVDAASRGFSVARTASAPLFVFLARGGCTPTLVPFPVECAASYFGKYLWHHDRSPHESRLRRWLANGARRIEYENVDDAVDILESLVTDR